MARAVFLLLDFYLSWHFGDAVARSFNAIIDKIDVSGKFEYERKTS